MLLQRREIIANMMCGEIVAFQVYSDASPIRGNEIQGLVLDICYKNGDIDRITMPSGTLSYGRCGVLNKTAALMFSFWLLVGPSETMLRKAFSLVRTAATDFGVEMGTLDVPDFIGAFMARLQGQSLYACRALVNPRVRLLPLALRISGWSHLFGNPMKFIAKSHPAWPSILSACRDLVAFYRMTGWRDAGGRCDLVPLGHFNAGFTKWRSETIAVCFSELDRMADISRHGVREEFFQHFQDRDLLIRVLRHCTDGPLWDLIHGASGNIFGPLEKGRRWGMTCECPDHIADRQRGVKHISCKHNGRKLRTAFKEASDMSSDMLQLGRCLPLEACNGNEVVNVQLRRMLLVGAAELKLRTKYLGLVPWR